MATQPPATSAPAPAPTSTATTSKQLAAALAANKLRLVAIADRLASYFNNDLSLNTSDLFHLIFALARGIDYSLSGNDIPGMSHRLPSLVKQAYNRRHDQLLHSAIMVLMISAKNACKNGWFPTPDTEELSRMANELFSSFCTAVCAPDVESSVEVILKIMPRFYPQLKFCGLVISFEAKSGYDILMSDFQVGRNFTPEQKFRLLVIERDKLETSSCLINPQQVSFLVNGKAVERRTNFSMDPGPQIPTDITKMLKYGTNIIQSIGYFDGNYIIAIASMRNISPPDASKIEDYVHPVVPTSISDSDIMEGPSRITLNCPISFKRIKTPVKGQNCKHLQCFDYDNYMEINSRKPTWRCACCNSPTSFIDLRVDQNMFKILQETGEDMVNIVISADGSWMPVDENNESMNQLNSEKSAGKRDSNVERERSTSPNIVDLTLEELCGINTCEIAEQKPVKDQLKLPGYQHFSESSTFCVSTSAQAAPYLSRDSFSSGLFVRTGGYSIGGLESLMSNVLQNSIQTDAVSSANYRDSSSNVDLINSALAYPQISQDRQHAENMQLGRSLSEALLVNGDNGRPQIPRYVTRIPTAVQALAAPTQAPVTSRRLQSDLLSPNHGSLNSSPYQTLSSSTSMSSGFNPINNDMETEHSRSLNLASSSMHHHSASQSQPHSELNASVLNASGLRVPNLTGSQASQENLRGAGAYRVQQVPRFPAVHLQQTPTQPSMQQSSVETTRSNLLAGWSSAQAAMMRAGAARHLSTNRVSSVPAVAGMNNTQTLTRPEEFAEQPVEQSWQPTGRMRGSLTGSAYQAALNQYSVSPATQSRQPNPNNSNSIPQPQVTTGTAEDLAPYSATSTSPPGQDFNGYDNLGS